MSSWKGVFVEPYLSFARRLEAAANHLGEVPAGEIQALLRHAAIRLDNTGGVLLADDVEDAVRDAASDTGQGRDDAIRIIIRQWLEQNRYLPPSDALNLLTST